jgi:hypothetical protein
LTGVLGRAGRQYEQERQTGYNASRETTFLRVLHFTVMPKQKKSDESLKGWAAIAKFLSQPVSTVQRWANEGMPVTRIGRYVAASPNNLQTWLSREAGTKETVHIPSENADLLADLKRGLSEARKAHRKARSH